MPALWIMLTLAVWGGNTGEVPSVNPLLKRLTEQGVRLQNGKRVTLPEPVMAAGLDAAGQRRVLRSVADKYPLDRFLRESIVAPFVLEINSVEDDAGQRTGQRVDFYFVAYGELDALTRDDLFRELAGADEKRSGETVEARELTEQELNARQLTPREDGQRVESYVMIDAGILERVRLQGVSFTVRERTENVLIGTWLLDERLRDDPELPSRWRPITRDEAGRDVLGDATPYSGAGGYIRATPLHEPAGAMFVECHAVFDEPEGWFEGRNLLRSKLPLVVQDNVRSFRRKLAKATADEADASFE